MRSETSLRPILSLTHYSFSSVTVLFGIGVWVRVWNVCMG